MQSAASVEYTLRSLLFGQDAAITAIMPVIEILHADLAPEDKPAAAFLLLGPTGTGKTKTVEALAQALHGSANMMVKIDCGEFHSDHEVAKILGAPPGYLGHRETRTLLTQTIIKNNTSDECGYTIILFDEIEKAAPAVFRALLGVLDKGTLTLGTNEVVRFANTIVFFTSNLGARAMQDCLQPRMGFERPVVGDVSSKLKQIGEQAARKKFAPEFMNRLDGVITYNPLSDETLQQILHAEIEAVGDKIHRKMRSLSFFLLVTDAAREWLLKRGTSRIYGARELKRVLQREVVHPIARMINNNDVFPNGVVRVSLDGDNLKFTSERSAEWQVAR